MVRQLVIPVQLGWWSSGNTQLCLDGYLLLPGKETLDLARAFGGNPRPLPDALVTIGNHLLDNRAAIVGEATLLRVFTLRVFASCCLS
jgi:hypothetical protein